jgi:Calpain family cysteine protease
LEHEGISCERDSPGECAASKRLAPQLLRAAGIAAGVIDVTVWSIAPQRPEPALKLPRPMNTGRVASGERDAVKGRSKMISNLASDSILNATAHSTTPAWVGGLSTSSVRADMTAEDVNGTVTYSGLENVFADLAATLSASNASLTAAEMSDLKTIAAHLNSGMSTSPYLAYITHALVDGNAANKSWTGGAASATPLGDLKAGSSATQLSELVGKWFLGTDLPSSTIDLPTEKTYGTVTVSYAPSSDPLFDAGGPSMNDVNQGHIGDCYFLATLAETAKQNPGIISSMFTANGNDTYGVRFYIDGVATYVTVNNWLPTSFTNNTLTSSGDIWASLAEKAYAQLQASGDITGTHHKYGNSFSTIGNDGNPAHAIEQLTGASTITEFFKTANENSWSEKVLNSSLHKTDSSSGIASASLFATLVADLSKGDDVLVTSRQNGKDEHGHRTLVSNHIFSVIGYDSANDTLELRNPWGTRPDQHNDTTFKVGLSTLLSDGDTITVDNVGNNVSQLTQAMAAFSPPAGAAATPVHADAVATLPPLLASPAH